MDIERLTKEILFPVPTSTWGKGSFEELVYLQTSDGIVFPILHYKKGSSTVIVNFHGNGSDIGTRYEEMKATALKLPYDTINMEYPGYGDSRTVEPSEQNCYKAAQSLIHYVQQNGFKRVVLAGYSLGTAVASWTARRMTEMGFPPHLLILIAPFYSARRLAREKFGIPEDQIPDMFNNATHLEGVNCRVCFIHGQADVVVPWQHSVDLYKKYKHRKELMIFPHEGHYIISWDKVDALMKTHL